MNRFSVFRLAAMAAMGMMCGCVTNPAPEGQASSAYAVGDRTRIMLEEVVVSLPLKGAAQPYQNLHIALAATINPLKSSVYTPYTVTDILQRLEARIGARVVEVFSSKKEQSLDDLPELRAQASREAQSVVDEAMRRWQHGPEYEVRILVVSLYWTDGSVGRAPIVRRWW